ncbi:DUF3626 domain-containing protein [Streptomyces sp. DSM 42041]|uniref:DUF3626 domain-containing protein n=1 Tax=Streptomyces hazeniae TaxID=3075538 RepID=A0ABU2NT00_9ACTN|nr:DUF3626 domain-containing protein [Streptomyces sp. DSM 42041]MDT0379328.1 DUF3626 domain-containing protein [Streptomyces sp. DSM 42041]
MSVEAGRASRADRAVRHVAALSGGAPAAAAWRVTLNFHPDRVHGGAAILDALAEGGLYRSQFVTGTSNGGLTAHPGGDRWRWESRLFGRVYDDAPPGERPVYGALNHRGRSYGGAARFGSAHFRLTASARARATFCYPDSCTHPADLGVTDTVARLAELADADGRDPLDDYVEAQVHGEVRLDRDVEALVLDPCFRGTEVAAAADRLPCAVEWHQGFRLSVDELRRHPEFRGPDYVALGAEVAEHGLLDPAVLGRAVRRGRHAPQALKKVWHYVARFGTGGTGGGGGGA